MILVNCPCHKAVTKSQEASRTSPIAIHVAACRFAPDAVQMWTGVARFEGKVYLDDRPFPRETEPEQLLETG